MTTSYLNTYDQSLLADPPSRIVAGSEGRLRLSQVEKETLSEQLKGLIQVLRTQLLDSKVKKYVEPSLLDLQPGLENDLKAAKVWVEKTVDGRPELCLTIGNCLRIENRVIGDRPTFICLCSCVDAGFRNQLQDQISKFTGRSLDNQMAATSYALLQLQLYLNKVEPGFCLRCVAER